MSDNNEVRELRELLTEIKVSIGEIQTEMRGLRSVASDVKEIGKVADLAFQNTLRHEKQFDKLSGNIKWAIGLAITSIFGIVGLFLR